MTTFLLDICDGAKRLVELLKLSLVSSEFYKKVYSQFVGLGLRYIFTLCFIGTVASGAVMIARFHPIVTYFETRAVSNKITSIIDSTINSWHTITYDGVKIISDEKDPIMVKGADTVIIAIDAEDKLTGAVKKTIPIVFGRTKLFFNFNTTKESSGNYQLQYEYSGLFGSSKKLIDSEELVSLIKSYIEYFDKIFILVVIPVMILLNLATLIFEKALMVVIVYFALKTFVNKQSSMKSAIRIVAFSCGISALLLPMTIVFPIFGTFANAGQLWTSFLIMHAITSMKR